MTSILKTELEKFGVGHLDVETVLRSALRNGGSLAELYFEETQACRLMFEGGRLDKVSRGTDRGVGLRIIFGGRSVYGYTTDLSQAALLSLAQNLGAAVIDVEKKARTGALDWRLSRQPVDAISAYRVDRPAADLPLKDKLELAKRIDAGARAELPTARNVRAFLLDSRRRFLLVNSDGTLAPDSKLYLQCYCEVLAEKDGRVETGFEGDGGYVGLDFFDRRKPEDIGREAARVAKVMLDAKPAPAGTLPVVISAEAGGTMIHEAVGHGLEADLVYNGLSVYQGKLGQQVASSLVTVVDDGTMPGKRGSYAFDDEGNPSKKTTLIENGVLKSYLTDKLSGYKFDLEATGNGRRESFRKVPIVRMTNTYIAPGKDDPAAILRDTKKGIYVRGMGGGQVNTVTGDFVFAVTEGYLIQDGKLGPAIRGATLVGNGPKVLSQVDRVGTDLGWATGTCGKEGQGAPVTDAQPTLRIPELTVGGEVPAETYFK